jgi:hypothetical protein
VLSDIRQISGEARIALSNDWGNGQQRSSPTRGVRSLWLTTLHCCASHVDQACKDSRRLLQCGFVFIKANGIYNAIES